MNQRNFKQTRKRGITLVELMVAAAIIGFIIIVLSKLTDIASVSSQKFNRSTDVNYLVGEVTQHLSSPYNCIETFRDIADPNLDNFLPLSIVRRVSIDRSVAPPTVSVPTTGRTLYIGSAPEAIPYGPSKAKVDSYELKGIGTGLDSYLEIKISGEGVGNSEMIRKVALVTEWVGNDLVACRALAQSTTELWSRGADRDIYYMGPVGIGTSEPDSAVALEIAGDMQVLVKDDGSGGDITAHAFYYDSDLRLKQKVEAIQNPFQALSKLRGVEFDWRDNGEHDFGFIAQEVREEIPEIVHENSEGKLSVDYVKVIPFLVEAIKEQQQDIKELQDEIRDLEK